MLQILLNEWMNEWMNESVYSLKLYNFYEWEQWSWVNQLHGYLKVYMWLPNVKLMVSAQLNMTG